MCDPSAPVTSCRESCRLTTWPSRADPFGLEHHVAARLQVELVQRRLEGELPAVERRGERQDRRLELAAVRAERRELVVERHRASAASRWARSTAVTTRGRVGDPDEAELAVVGAGGVEVDRPHAQQAVAQRLLGVDVLHAVDARLLLVLGEQAAPDVEPLRADQVRGGRAPDQPEHQHERHQHEADHDAERDAADQRDHDRHGHGGGHAPDVERQQRAPTRMPLEHDLLAGMQLHARTLTVAMVLAPQAERRRAWGVTNSAATAGPRRARGRAP